ncbi:hypothetical protein EAW52_25380 [Pseudomonas sp. LTJR-52]|nr:hypothetical protein EAW52_25380 [Pseudomonas sp. LTJR-52]
MCRGCQNWHRQVQVPTKELVGNLCQDLLVLPSSFCSQLKAILLDWQRRLAVNVFARQQK